jgi:hypothetical protein
MITGWDSGATPEVAVIMSERPIGLAAWGLGQARRLPTATAATTRTRARPIASQFPTRT